jgi:hypothetical protein
VGEERRGEWGELIMEARRRGRMRGDAGCLSFEWGTVLAPVRGKKPQFFALHFGNWVWKWENRDRTFLYLFANLNELWNIRLEKTNFT